MGSAAETFERVSYGTEPSLVPVTSGYALGPTVEQTDQIVDQLEYIPSEEQQQILHCPLRLILVAGGERAGKSFVSGLFGTTHTPWGRLFWIVGPDYELARAEFSYWVDNLVRLGAIERDLDISMPKQGTCQARTKTGQLIQTKTSDDTSKLASVAPDGIIMSEAGQHSYDSYLRCVGRVAERRGWLLMSGTFERSQRWYPEKYEEWQDPNNLDLARSFSLPSWSNLAIYPGGREDPEMLRLEALYQRVDGLFDERIAAQPVPATTLVFREFRRSIHYDPRVHFDPNKPVYLAIDPSAGTRPYSVLAVQFTPHERVEVHPDPIDYCDVIDEIYVTGAIGEDVIEMAQDKYWFPQVRGGAIDKEAPDEQKRWLKYAHVHLHSEDVGQLEGIRRLKSFLYYRRDKVTGLILEAPHLRISENVRSLAYEFTKFKRNPPKDDEHSVRDVPPSDQPNHSIKALWYLLYARYGAVKGQRLAQPAYNWQRKH